MKLKKSLFFSFTLAVATCLSVTSNAMVVDVFALENSTGGGVGASTGLILDAGDEFSTSVAAGDLWNAGNLPRWSNADGLVGDLFATGTDDSGQAAGVKIGRDFGLHAIGALSLPFGTLVGSIDNNFFALGTSFTGNAIASGELLLWYWDVNKGDNTDKIAVSIESGAASVPEPGTLALLILGGLALARAKARASL